MKVFFIVGVCLGLVHGRIPEGTFPKCSRMDPNLEVCLIQGVESVRSILMEGLPEISFPALEPFTMSRIPLDISLPGLKLKGEATNIEATGAGHFKIKSFNIDVKKKTVEVMILIPHLEVTADYTTKDSKVLFFNVDSSGQFTGTFNDVKAVIKARGRIERNGGLDYVRVSNVDVKIDVGKASSIHVNPDTSRVSSRWAAKMINMAPAKMVMKMLQNSINKTAGEIIKKYINEVLNTMPLQDLLED